MSMIREAVRSIMTMRAVVQRQQSSPGVDAWGEPLPVAERPLGDSVPCRAWHPTDSRLVFDDEKQGVMGALRLAMPRDADVREGDTISTVEDRRGVELFAGPLRVTAVMRHPDSLAVMARIMRSGGERA